jgi:hypothetical protein
MRLLVLARQPIETGWFVTSFLLRPQRAAPLAPRSTTRRARAAGHQHQQRHGVCTYVRICGGFLGGPASCWSWLEPVVLSKSLSCCCRTPGDHQAPLRATTAEVHSPAVFACAWCIAGRPPPPVCLFHISLFLKAVF